jgi:hypothetical protein
VLVNADKTALEYGKEAFERVHMHIVARPLKFRMVYGFVAGDGRIFEVLRLVADKTATL